MKIPNFPFLTIVRLFFFLTSLPIFHLISCVLCIQIIRNRSPVLLHIQFQGFELYFDETHDMRTRRVSSKSKKDDEVVKISKTDNDN
ncbi:hypothetical protein ACS0TY_025612 [Phlomoides rotata]